MSLIGRVDDVRTGCDGPLPGVPVPTDEQARADVEAALTREYRFQRLLSEAMTADVPELGIADALHRHLGLGVSVEDAFGNVLARGGADGGGTYPRLTRAQRDHLTDAAQRGTGPVRMRDLVASVAASRGTVLGLVVVLDPRGTLEPAGTTPETDAHPDGPRTGARHAIGLATSALALHLLHRRHLARTELRLRHDLVETVLLECSSPDGVETEVERRIGRASALSHDLTGPHRVLAVRPHHGRWPGGEPAGDLMEQAARRLGMSYLGTLRGQTAILVCGTPAAWRIAGGSAAPPWSGRPTTTPGAHAPRRPCPGSGSGSGSGWQHVHDAFTDVLRDVPAVGVGSFVDRPEHLPRSYREALQALTVCTRRTDTRGLITFEDLGLYRLLATPEGRREAGAFVADWLGSLLAYDDERHADLVHTLGVYLDHGGNYDATAGALHIHRSTLRYRLQRIRELSGHDLTDTDTRLNLHVAVRAAVVADPPAPPPR